MTVERISDEKLAEYRDAYYRCENLGPSIPLAIIAETVALRTVFDKVRVVTMSADEYGEPWAETMLPILAELPQPPRPDRS